MSAIDAKNPIGFCEAHGHFEKRKLVRFGGQESFIQPCPICDDEKAEREGKVQAERKRVEEERAWQQKLDRACIPERFRDKRLANYVAEHNGQQQALDFATDYMEHFDDVLRTGRSAVFIGSLGTGKTHLAVGIALDVMARFGHNVLYTKVARAIRYIKSSWGRDSQITESDAIYRLASPDLLILDEVGVQYGSDTEKNLLFDVINERYERRLPTIYISNLVPQEVTAHLGERVIDRLREDGGEYVVFNWESFRSKAGTSGHRNNLAAADSGGPVTVATPG